MTVFVVSHFHWDREWYRTMQGFRARLVDAIDLVLDLVDADPDHRFLLDGQTVVLEDYLVVRPDRRDDLRRHVEAGRLGIGPWYVQPDSLLPSGESLVRNLLAGRRVGRAFGPVSTTAYVPDSFGHPAQLPQVFAGFGLDGFVYWRGNGDELDRLGARWRWQAPDGTTVRSLLLSEGYFAAARVDDLVDAGAADPGHDGVGRAADRLVDVVGTLRDAGEDPPLLMNGFDHTRPDRHVGAVVERVAERLGEPVRRALLDEVVAALPDGDRAWPVHTGELVGGRVANLLPGVWSTRIPLKVADRRGTVELERWAEPWAALGRGLGVTDERPALRSAWRSLLRNQAHDSICGCSTDATHDRMAARYHDAEHLAAETTRRVLERLAGRGDDREVPWSEDQRVTVFNPSPHDRTDVVRIPLDAHPALPIRCGEPAVHPLALAGLAEHGATVDGRPARLVPSPDPARVRWLPDQQALDLELVADVPAFGCRTYAVRLTEPQPDAVDDGREIVAGETAVRADDDGTLSVSIGGRTWSGVVGVDDVGDRGDSYDADLVGEPVEPAVAAVRVVRTRHASGLQSLEVRRTLALPAALDPDRRHRTDDRVECDLTVTARIAAGVRRVDLTVRLDNRARDHRLRLRFPTGGPASSVRAATTFDVVPRRPGPPPAARWVHPPPTTFCHQGWIAAGGLVVAAPGLPEAELDADGTVALTLVRSVGWLARFDLDARPIPAGPAMRVDGAQCLEVVEADLHLLPDAGEATAAAVADAVAGLRGVVAGPAPLLDDGEALLRLDGEGLVLSALKLAEEGEGLVVRVLNTGDHPTRAELALGLDVADARMVRLDEEPTGGTVEVDRATGRVAFDVPGHALRTVRLEVDHGR